MNEKSKVESVFMRMKFSPGRRIEDENSNSNFHIPSREKSGM